MSPLILICGDECDIKNVQEDEELKLNGKY
jgi:hypothetical protein